MRRGFGVIALAVALLCVGCSQSTDGQATGGSSSVAPTSTVSTAPTTSEPADSGMKGKTEFTQDELCELLTSAEAQQFGGSAEGKPTMNVTNSAPLCQWTDTNSLVIGYRPDSTVAELKSGPTIKKTNIKINGIPAVQSDDSAAGGLCQVGIDLTSHSELVVGVLVFTDISNDDRCDVAKQMATVVFSKVK